MYIYIHTLYHVLVYCIVYIVFYILHIMMYVQHMPKGLSNRYLFEVSFEGVLIRAVPVRLFFLTGLKGDQGGTRVGPAGAQSLDDALRCHCAQTCIFQCSCFFGLLRFPCWVLFDGPREELHWTRFLACSSFSQIRRFGCAFCLNAHAPRVPPTAFSKGMPRLVTFAESPKKACAVLGWVAITATGKS